MDGIVMRFMALFVVARNQLASWRENCSAPCTARLRAMRSSWRTPTRSSGMMFACEAAGIKRLARGEGMAALLSRRPIRQ